MPERIRKGKVTDTYITETGAKVEVTDRVVKANEVKATRKKGPGKAHRQGISLMELFQRFPNDRAAEQWFEDLRWPDGKKYCPHCGGVDKIKETKNRQPLPYRCGDCDKRFSVREGTLMGRSHIGFQRWAVTIYTHLCSLKGVSSMKLSRDLGITQKSAWFMLHRIRDAYGYEPSLLEGPVEVDETYVGGKEANKHSDKKLRAGRGPVGKAIVAGVKDRKTGEIRAQVVSNTDRATLQGFIAKHVPSGAQKFTDEHSAYKGLHNHEAVQHSIGQWVDGQAHVNGMESFWSMFKRGFHGVYHRMSVEHLHRYVQEFAGRHNIRDKDTIDQMQDLVAGMVGKRLMYKDLIGNVKHEKPAPAIPGGGEDPPWLADWEAGKLEDTGGVVKRVNPRR